MRFLGANQGAAKSFKIHETRCVRTGQVDLANRRLQPLGHLSAAGLPQFTTVLQFICRTNCPIELRHVHGTGIRCMAVQVALAIWGRNVRNRVNAGDRGNSGGDRYLEKRLPPLAFQKEACATLGTGIANPL